MSAANSCLALAFVNGHPKHTIMPRSAGSCSFVLVPFQKRSNADEIDDVLRGRPSPMRQILTQCASPATDDPYHVLVFSFKQEKSGQNNKLPNSEVCHPGLPPSV